MLTTRDGREVWGAAFSHITFCTQEFESHLRQKKKVFFIFYFLVYFFSAYKSINDCFNIREIVVFIRSREGYNWAIPLGTPRVIAQF